MEYKTPLIEFQSELYKMLSDKDELDFPVYDAGIAAEDILVSFKDLEHTKFGVIADLFCIQDHAKADAIIWKLNVRIEMISTYRGRMKIADMIHNLGSCITRNEDTLDHNLQQYGYSLVKVNIGDANIGTATHDGGLTWQNGFLNLTFWLSQIEFEQ